ncbi:MAG: AAA family ATPase, partial [Lachnospiraceae bacterium]|nr:AAA family ATPase [Lachnospiraceae bacterium]
KYEEKKEKVMKVSVCGKGGSGKSTIVALLARELVTRGKEVLIVDADESNYGLHRHLGMDNPDDFMEYVGGKMGFVQNMGSTQEERTNFMNRYFKEDWGLSDIPPMYFTEKNGIKLMCSGKIREINEGCACPFHAVLKAFIMNLKLTDNQVAILDMEAGIEHFGRGIDDDMDLIFMVCDPSYESLQLADKITKLADHIQKPVYYILNKIDDTTELIIKKAIEKKQNIICGIPANRQLLEESLSGEEISLKVPEINKVADIVTE